MGSSDTDGVNYNKIVESVGDEDGTEPKPRNGFSFSSLDNGIGKEPAGLK